MRSLLWKWSFLQEVNGALQIGLIAIFTFVGSVVITKLISYFPWAEYIIGFRQKR